MATLDAKTCSRMGAISEMSRMFVKLFHLFYRRSHPALISALVGLASQTQNQVHKESLCSKSLNEPVFTLLKARSEVQALVSSQISTSRDKYLWTAVRIYAEA